MGFAAFYLRRLTPPRTPFKTWSSNKKKISANQASYYSGIDRARNADLDTPNIEFLVDNRSPLVPKQGREGSSVPQHDFFLNMIL